jgi:uncharacterized protein
MWQLAGGLLLGLLSSFHCVGMCGPLAMALPVRHLPRAKQLFASTLYHTGRVITYTLAGALFGLAGRGVYMAGFQQWFSMSIGMVLLLTALLYGIFHWSYMPSWLHSFYLKIQQLMTRLLHWRGYTGFLLLGMANGLLPCGMVYLAIAGALTASSVIQGILFMCAFGIGTLPAMIALSFFGVRIRLSHRQLIKKWMPYAIAGIACLFLLRGMNLGIPFLSPVLPQAPAQAVSCH